MPITNLTGVLCCGNICLDRPVWPVPRIAWETTTWVQTIGESLGGNGANTSYALATLGTPVRLVGVVGTDENGGKLLAALQAASVGVDNIRQTSDLPTTSSVVVVNPEGGRLFLHLPGASKSLQADDVQFTSLGACSHFHFANPFSLPKIRTQGRELLERARAAGLSTSMDLGYDSAGRWILDIEPCLPLLDILFLNESELAAMTGMAQTEDALWQLRKLGAGDIVVKLGKNGCTVLEGESRYSSPGFEVPVIDSTGAGDSFVGGFLAALHRSLPYRRCAEFANAVGASKVQSLGAAAGVLPFEQTEIWIRGRSTLVDS